MDFSIQNLGSSTGIQINWSTAGGDDAATFYIERSLDSLAPSFDLINTVQGESGPNAQSYRFTDDDPYLGKNFYRIVKRSNGAIECSSKILSVCFGDYDFSITSISGQSLGSQGTEISWALSNSAGNVSFLIQRANGSGASFNKIGEVAGNAATQYSYQDSEAPNGILRYRIQIKDQSANLCPSAPISVCQGDCTPLKLEAFSGNSLGWGNGIRIEWRLTGDLSQTRVRVERSSNGSIFSQIASIDNQPGVQNYQYLDETAALGNNDYRLIVFKANRVATRSDTIVIDYGSCSDLNLSNITLTQLGANQGVDLQWSSAGPLSDLLFTILRGVSPNALEVIGTLNASSTSSFSFQDTDPFLGTNYYQINLETGCSSPLSAICFGEDQERYLDFSLSNLGNASGVGLTWRSTETQPEGLVYFVERSLDGILFQRIGEVEASLQTQHSFQDTALAKGVNYYRLASSPNSGTPCYSDTLDIFWGNAAALDIKVFPIPITKASKVYFPNDGQTPAQLIITDMKGSPVFKQSYSLDQSGIEEPLDALLPPGLFILSVIRDGQAQALRILKYPNAE